MDGPKYEEATKSTLESSVLIQLFPFSEFGSVYTHQRTFILLFPGFCRNVGSQGNIAPT